MGKPLVLVVRGLDNFLNSRSGDLATLLIVNREGTNREGLFATKETGTGTVGPKLELTVPEPASMSVFLLGLVSIGLFARRHR